MANTRIIAGKCNDFFHENSISSTKTTPHTSGTPQIKALVILVEFKDVKFSVNDPLKSFNSMINSKGYSYNGATGSAADYLNSNFKNFYTFSFDICGIFTLPHDISKYGAATNTTNDIDAKQMAVDACKLAYDSGVDFSLYDSNNNGTVDNIHIIFAGYNQSSGADTDAIWSHQWSIEDKNIQYNGVKLGSYSCSSELKGSEGTTINTIGSFCHEYLHSWGLIDMYDTNSENEGLSNALYGNLSIMDNGYELNNGNTPPYLNAIEREILGIADIYDLEPDNSYTLESINLNGKVGRIKTNTEGEYFLLECRSMGKRDKYIGGEGLIIYHIDKSDNIYGGISAIKRWNFNNVNTFAEHECAKVITACSIENSNTISNIFFPGTKNVTFINSTQGYSKLLDWHNNPIGIALKDILYTNNKISFTTCKDYVFGEQSPVATKISSIEYQESARINWDCDAPNNSLKWSILLYDTNNNLIAKEITDSTTYLATNLSPNAKYNIEIISIQDKVIGKKATYSFQTKDITSEYPHIFVKGNYKQGEIIDLRVFNICEPYNSIIWYINNTKIQETTYKIPAGCSNFEITAQIIYKDGTNEYIHKTISAD